jgi:MoxR-like ATPase
MFMETKSHTENRFESRIDLSGLQLAAEKIRREIGKIIIGQSDAVELIILAVLSDGHILLEGVPGVAKTLTAKLTARTMSVHFSRIQFTPDLMPSDITGSSVFNVQNRTFEFKRGPVFANIVLCDEINRAPAKTQAALFECMQEKQITVDGISHSLPNPFLVLATQNPIEQEGTYRLPEAQLDRFLFKIMMDYPNAEEEIKMLQNVQERDGRVDAEQIQAVLNPSELDNYRNLIKKIRCEDPLLAYIVAIVTSTRKHKNLYLGASPRASLSILSASKAKAAIQGRDFVTPEDIKWIVPAVLRHRIQLTPESEMEGNTPEKAIGDLLRSIEIPR